MVTFASICFAAALAGETVLESPALRIRFTDAERGFAVSRIENRLVGDAGFVRATEKGDGLWAVTFARREGGTNVYTRLKSRDAADKSVVRTPDGGARLLWKNLSLPDEPGAVDVAAIVAFDASGASKWTFAIRNRSETWAQHTVEYPILGEVMPRETGDALLPWSNMGGRLHRKLKADRLPVPHRDFHMLGSRMPVSAFMHDGAGLYFAAHDGEQRIKRLRISDKADVWFSTVLENAGIAGKAAEGPRYPVVLAAFKGDWWEAAHIYRKWALRQKWCRKGKIAYRKDFPKNVTEVDLWVNSGASYNSFTNHLACFKRLWPEMKIGFGLACWYAVQPGNRLNPEFFPLRDPLYPQAMKHPLAKDVHLMPYVNGRIWDMQATGFAYAKVEATCDENSKLYEEHYGDKTTFAVMCPYCPKWQKIQRDLGRRCLDTFGCDMLYYDQVSCSRPQPCYNPAHGHPLGGGTWWIDGYRKMFEAIHGDFSARGAAVTSEQLGESLIDVVDALLNASDMLADDVPLFPAVYQGYTVHFGRAVGCDKPHQTKAWRLMQDAKTVLWGQAPGWIGPHIWLLPVYWNEAENLMKVARFRRAHADFLVFGTLENEVRFEKNDPEVYGTVWKDADGKRTAAAMVNSSAAEKRVRYRLPGETAWREATLPAFDLFLIEIR